MPLVVAVGIADGIAALPGTDPEAVRIKWPNDILVDGAKCVGILIESERVASGANAVAIGFGVNLDPPNANTPYPIAALRDLGFRGSAEDVFAIVASEVEAALARWARGREFARLRQDWISRSRGIGEACTVNLSNRSITGRFVELDPTGRLVLETASGRREVFSAGDLFLSTAAPPVTG